MAHAHDDADAVPPGDPHEPLPATVTRRIAIPAGAAWLLLTDVRNHARWIPWTRVDALAPLRVGDAFAAASGPGWLPGGGLVDRMIVERLDPPTDGRTGIAVFRKLGPVLLGTAEVHVRPDGDACDVTWIEKVHVRGLPVGLTAGPLRSVLAAMTRLALRRFSDEVTAAEQA